MIGKNIRRLRIEKEISQTALAKAINVTQGAISQWEKGLTSPDTAQLVAVAKFFGVSLEDLVFEEGDIVQSTMKKEPSLNPAEAKLITDFRSLTWDGKEHVLDYMGAMKVVYKKSAVPSGLENVE